jgi:HPt (histidine-containing phosphotransfer) domain-containing protein
VSDLIYIQLEYLDLMSMGDEETRQTLLGMLIEEIPEEIPKLRVAIETSNRKMLKEVSHKLKSTLSFTGNEEISAANRRLEEIAMSGDLPLEEAKEKLLIVEEYGPLIVEELKSQLK